MKLIHENPIKKDGHSYTIKIFESEDGVVSNIFRADGSCIDDFCVKIVHPDLTPHTLENWDISENIVQILATLLFTLPPESGWRDR